MAEIHHDKTAERAVDACGGTYTAEQKESGYADGHFDALDAAMMAVRPVDALMAELLDALQEAKTYLSNTRANVMVELNKYDNHRWEGVPESLKGRIAIIDAIIAKATQP